MFAEQSALCSCGSWSGSAHTADRHTDTHMSVGRETDTAQVCLSVCVSVSGLSVISGQTQAAHCHCHGLAFKLRRCEAQGQIGNPPYTVLHLSSSIFAAFAAAAPLISPFLLSYLYASHFILTFQSCGSALLSY